MIGYVCHESQGKTLLNYSIAIDFVLVIMVCILHV